MRASLTQGVKNGHLQCVREIFLRAYELEDQGRFDDAFSKLVEANRLSRQPVAAEAALRLLRSRLDRARSLFTSEFIASEKGGNPSREPIFIVGMPRSGSTLVEQILAAHPHVVAMGECNASHFALDDVYPISLSAPRMPKHYQSAGEIYLAEIRKQGRRRSLRFTDKTLSNIEIVGALALIFPRATFILCRRHPMDICVSLFRRFFRDSRGNEATYDLSDIARRYVLTEQLVQHWKNALPGRMKEVQHESLVADANGTVTDLLSACGLRFDERCLRPHEAEQRVRGGSELQVREPINTRGVGRWRNYEKHLGPLIEALGPYANPG